MNAAANVLGIIAAIVISALPLAAFFWAGRRFERWAQARQTVKGAEAWLREPRTIHSDPGPEVPHAVIEAGLGFPRSRHRAGSVSRWRRLR